MYRRRFVWSGIRVALIASLAACSSGTGGVGPPPTAATGAGGNGTPTSGTAGLGLPMTSGGAAPNANVAAGVNDALRVARGQASPAWRRLTVSPTSFAFTSRSAQNLTLTVTHPTTVYAASSDPTAADVSPDHVTVTAPHGGKATFSVAPHNSPSTAVIGLIDREFEYAFVPLTVNLRRSLNLYVANASGNTVTVYGADANGNMFPTRTIAGSNTGVNYPQGVAIDDNGTLFVANRRLSSQTTDSVMVYAPGANGNVRPIRTIAGANTGISGQRAIALDAAGELFVLNFPQFGEQSVTVYAPGADGDVKPIRTITGSVTGLSGPVGAALDGSGNLFVSNNDGRINVYASGANGNVRPIRTIEGNNTGFPSGGLAFDAGGNLFAAGSAAVDVYAPGANGNVHPIRTIAGSSTELYGPFAVAIDSSGELFVTNEGPGPPTDLGFVTVYAPGANGNAAPIRKLEARNTALAQPAGVALDSSGALFVANQDYSANFPKPYVTVYAPRANGNVTPIRTIAGSNTGLSEIRGCAVGNSGDLFVVNAQSAASPFGSVTVYGPGANGNVAPRRTIVGSSTGLGAPLDVAVDNWSNVFVTNAGNSVTVYAAGANGNVAPLRTITGSKTGLNYPIAVAIDSSDNVYATNYFANSVTIYAAGANGNVTPIRTLAGSVTGLNRPVGAAVDAGGNLFVGNSSNSSVTVYSPSANGNARPIRTIAGDNTTFNGVDGIALDGSGKLYVTNDAIGSVTVLPAGADGNVAPRRTITNSIGLDGPTFLTLGS